MFPTGYILTYPGGGGGIVIPVPALLSDRAAAVIEHVRQTLVGLTDAADEPYFDGVKVVDDVPSFVRVSDPLKVGRREVGIVAGRVQQGPGSDDAELATYRLPLELAVRFKMERVPGGGEQSATSEMDRLSQVVRDGLLVDRGRGGLCNLILWNRRPVNGTETNGDARLVTNVANQGFYTAVVPAECGWYKPR